MLDRIIRVLIRSFGCPRQPGVDAERPTGSAEAARGHPPLLPDFQPTDQTKVTRCCVLAHSMTSPCLSMLYHVFSLRGRIDSVISGAFQGTFRCVLAPGNALRPSQGPKNIRIARIHISDQETIVSGIASSVPGENPCQNRVFWLGPQQMSPPAALLPEIARDAAAISHGARHGSYHAPVIDNAMGPRPCGPPELKRHRPKKNSACKIKNKRTYPIRFRDSPPPQPSQSTRTQPALPLQTQPQNRMPPLAHAYVYSALQGERTFSDQLRRLAWLDSASHIG